MLRIILKKKRSFILWDPQTGRYINSKRVCITCSKEGKTTRPSFNFVNLTQIKV